MEMYNITLGNVSIDLPVDEEAFSYYELEGKTVTQTVRIFSIEFNKNNHKDVRLELLIFGWITLIAEKNIDSLALRPHFCDFRDEHRWDIIIHGTDTRLSLGIHLYGLLLARVRKGIRHEAT